MGQVMNNFIIIKSITIILVYVSRLKKNLSYVSLLSHTLSLCLMVKEKSPYFSLLSHTHSLCVFSKQILCSLFLGYLLEGGNTLLSPPWLSSRRRQLFVLSSLAISLKVVIPCSLLLDYLLESSNTLLSPPWASSQRQQ